MRPVTAFWPKDPAHYRNNKGEKFNLLQTLVHYFGMRFVEYIAFFFHLDRENFLKIYEDFDCYYTDDSNFKKFFDEQAIRYIGIKLVSAYMTLYWFELDYFERRYTPKSFIKETKRFNCIQYERGLFHTIYESFSAGRIRFEMHMEKKFLWDKTELKFLIAEEESKFDMWIYGKYLKNEILDSFGQCIIEEIKILKALRNYYIFHRQIPCFDPHNPDFPDLVDTPNVPLDGKLTSHPLYLYTCQYVVEEMEKRNYTLST